MKRILLYYILIFTVSFFVSCGDKNDDPLENIEPTAGLKKIQEFTDGNYTITAWNETGELRLGYTKVYFTVQDKEDNYVDNLHIFSAFPEMDMGMMTHGCPRSEIIKVSDKPLYEAYFAFTMYSGQSDGKWRLNLTYQHYVSDNFVGVIENVEIDVKNAFRPDGKTERKVIQSLVAADGSDKRYVVTLVEPQKPKVGVNDITAYIHERIDADTYNPVENFTLKLDPRMPSMENHSSPNNTDLTWDVAGKIYRGSVNFSMTGYWTLNLILQNDRGETLYGNAITDDTATGSLFFEVEF